MQFTVNNFLISVIAFGSLAHAAPTSAPSLGTVSPACVDLSVKGCRERGILLDSFKSALKLDGKNEEEEEEDEDYDDDLEEEINTKYGVVDHNKPYNSNKGRTPQPDEYEDEEETKKGAGGFGSFIPGNFEDIKNKFSFPGGNNGNKDEDPEEDHKSSGRYPDDDDDGDSEETAPSYGHGGATSPSTNNKANGSNGNKSKEPKAEYGGENEEDEEEEFNSSGSGGFPLSFDMFKDQAKKLTKKVKSQYMS